MLALMLYEKKEMNNNYVDGTYTFHAWLFAQLFSFSVIFNGLIFIYYRLLFIIMLIWNRNTVYSVLVYDMSKQLTALEQNTSG